MPHLTETPRMGLLKMILVYAGSAVVMALCVLRPRRPGRVVGRISPYGVIRIVRFVSWIGGR